MTAASCANTRGAFWEAPGAKAARLPHFIILDWNMPVMTGIDFLRALRAEFGPDKPEVIFCTTESELGRIMEALDNGAQEYVMKPFDEEILLGKLGQLGLLR